jgi:competence protein ComEA
MKAPTSDSISWWTRVRAWAGRPLGRAALVLGGLVVLSLVGRFAAAGSQQPANVTTVAATVTSAMNVAAAPEVIATPLVDAAAPSPVHHSSSATEDDPVYLNDASVEDLRRLPGVGEKRAEAILDLRHKLGRFHQVEDLLRVKGIGRATLRKLRPLVRIDHATDAGRP